jgi:hypothetical protein
MFTGQMSTIVGEQLISTRSWCIKRNKEKKMFFDFFPLRMINDFEFCLQNMFISHVLNIENEFAYHRSQKKKIRNGNDNIIIIRSVPYPHPFYQLLG